MIGFIVLANAITFGMQFISRSVLAGVGLESVAIYDSAQLLYGIVQMMFTGIGLAVVPYVSRLGSKGSLSWPWKKALILYVPIGFLILMMTSTPLVPTLLSRIGLSHYVSLLPVLEVRMLAVPLELLSVLGSSILIGLSRTKEYFLVALLVAPVHIVGSYFIAPLFGEVGVAMVSVLSLALLVSLIGWRLERK